MEASWAAIAADQVSTLATSVARVMIMSLAWPLVVRMLGLLGLRNDWLLVGRLYQRPN